MAAVIVVAAVSISSTLILHYTMPKTQDVGCTGRGGWGALVTFTALTMSGTPPNNRTVTWQTALVRCEIFGPFSSFKAQIFMDGSPLAVAARSLVGNTKISFGPSVTLIVHDLAGNGKLAEGDSFFIYGLGGTHDWKFSLTWAADGSEIQSASWFT